MTFSGLRLSVFCLILLGFSLLWFVLWLGVYILESGPPTSAATIDVVIPARSGIVEIERILADNQVIRDDRRFSLLAVLTGAARKLQAGEYRLRPGRKPLEILKILEQGRVLYRPVTIPEGTDTAAVAEILADGGWVEPSRFMELVHNRNFLDQLGVAAGSLEGYLFPDTYNLSKGQQDERRILTAMVTNHFKVYERLIAISGSRDRGLTHHEIVILASIVEKETGLDAERPLVASVFRNRLQKGMRLQADPTVLYRRPDNSGPLLRSELDRETPYNTYIIKGLPPGPITNPGEAALRAVIEPAKTDFLYFVARDDRSHYFSRTLEEHNRAVAEYRRRKAAE